MSIEHEHSVEIFGSRVRLLVGPPNNPNDLPATLACVAAEATLRVMQSRLTRFEASSELSRLNSSSEISVSVSPLLARTVEAAIWAAEFSGGLVDSTLLDELERAGYNESFVGHESAPLKEALRHAPARCPASPNPVSRWREISVDTVNSRVDRTPGVKIDSGGVGKGLAADIIAERFSEYESFVVDAGGDIRLGGKKPPLRSVEIEHPFSGETASSFLLSTGAVATSGLAARIWRTSSGFAHHLLDPSTGQPAWTGLVQATAIADSTLVAETLAKMALLAGPERARELLFEHGGLLIHDDGTTEEVGALGQPATTLEAVL